MGNPCCPRSSHLPFFPRNPRLGRKIHGRHVVPTHPLYHLSTHTHTHAHMYAKHHKTRLQSLQLPSNLDDSQAIEDISPEVFICDLCTMKTSTGLGFRSDKNHRTTQVVVPSAGDGNDCLYYCYYFHGHLAYVIIITIRNIPYGNLCMCLLQEVHRGYGCELYTPMNIYQPKGSTKENITY